MTEDIDTIDETDNSSNQSEVQQETEPVDASAFLAQAFQHQLDLSHQRFALANDPNLLPEDLRELEKLLQTMRDLSRQQLILQLHKTGARNEIGNLLRDTSDVYLPDSNYLCVGLQRFDLN